jgi:hypothetical protein
VTRQCFHLSLYCTIVLQFSQSKRRNNLRDLNYSTHLSLINLTVRPTPLTPSMAFSRPTRVLRSKPPGTYVDLVQQRRDPYHKYTHIRRKLTLLKASISDRAEAYAKERFAHRVMNGGFQTSKSCRVMPTSWEIVFYLFPLVLLLIALLLIIFSKSQHGYLGNTVHKALESARAGNKDTAELAERINVDLWERVASRSLQSSLYAHIEI